MLASKNAIARLTTTRTNTIGYIMVCMYVSLAHTQRETSALTDLPLQRIDSLLFKIQRDWITFSRVEFYNKI